MRKSVSLVPVIVAALAFIAALAANSWLHDTDTVAMTPAAAAKM